MSSGPAQNASLALAKRTFRTRKMRDSFYVIVGLSATILGMVTLSALVFTLYSDGHERFTYEFFTNFPSRSAVKAGILSAWVGSLLVIVSTALIGVPLGVTSGIYLEEYAPKNWITAIIEINVNNLAGVPSIIFGLLALGLFVYVFGLGKTILTAGLTLALLILPIIIVSTREATRAIPGSIREAAFAVGATKWQVIWDHVLPYASAGVLTGTIIGIGRAIGETAPLVTIGALTYIAFLPPSPISLEPPFVNFDWLFSPFTVMPIQTYNWTSRPDPAFHANAAALALTLLCTTLTINATAIVLRYRLRKRIKW
ncbi:MAG: phosphate ABC transporter permease PstA [Alphaproteobacteria bacterium]|nr:phosphate ABC transporter permease PstA [Alphaproteobacteria bacterium]